MLTYRGRLDGWLDKVFAINAAWTLVEQQYMRMVDVLLVRPES